jgi:hypothetical protein
MVGISAAYVAGVQILVPHQSVLLQPGWEDYGLRTSYEVPPQNLNLSSGWGIVRYYGETQNNESGFTSFNNTLTLYETFNGVNLGNDGGVTGIEIGRPVYNINTSFYPYTLVVRHKESTANFSLMFTLGVTDSRGAEHVGAWQHTSSNWENSEFDLQNMYRGEIDAVFLRFTDDFNKSFTGGRQYLYVQAMSLFRQDPPWTLLSSDPSGSELANSNGTLMLTVRGQLYNGLDVLAGRQVNSLLDTSQYKFLKISIMTSSLNTAAKIILWEGSQSYTVLLTTYDDRKWHTEIVDLSVFGIQGDVDYIQIGLEQLSAAPVAVIYFTQLSFNTEVIR